MSEPAVIIKDLTKQFKIPLEASTGAKQKLINLLKGRKGYREFSPLNNVSFTIEKGDFFGIVGRNGSGKSTLLKTIAGIYTPNSGEVAVNGKLVPFIELGVGFNPELTGRENVFLNGALLGFSRDDMEAMYDDIVDFAELHDFMEERLKNYSSGMQVRLAFSIAIRAQGDILLLDEVLAVGDEAFQKKCFTYFQSLKNNKKTVILVTHDMNAVREYCNKAILLDRGRIAEAGSAETVSRAYSDMFDPRTHEEEEIPETRWGTEELVLTSVKPDAANINEKDIQFAITIKSSVTTTEEIVLAYTLKDDRKQSLFGDKFTVFGSKGMKEGERLKCNLAFPNILSKGDYYLDLSLRFEHKDTYTDFWVDCTKLKLKAGGDSPLPINVSSTLSVEKK